MRLSTFAKLVAAKWNKNNPHFTSSENEFICITAHEVMRELKHNTNNIKLKEQYDSHYQKYIKRVNYMIKGCGTVTTFLIDCENDYFHSFENYTKAKWLYRKDVILPQLIAYFKAIEELSSIIKGDS